MRHLSRGDRSTAYQTVGVGTEPLDRSSLVLRPRRRTQASRTIAERKAHAQRVAGFPSLAIQVYREHTQGAMA
jgi:hypothetical protein